MPTKLHPPGKRGPYWVIRGNELGRRVEISTGTRDRREAQAAHYGWLQELTRYSSDQPRTFGEAIDAYSAFKNPRKLDASYLARLKADLGHKICADIIHADLVMVADHHYRDASNAHKNRAVITPASAVLHYAHEQRWCPYLRIKRYKVESESSREPAAAEDKDKLIAATVGPKRLLIAVLYETGLRIGDALALQAPAGSAEIDRLKMQKTKRHILPPLSAELERLIASSPRHQGKYLFPWRSRSGVYKWLWPLCKQLSIHVTPHMFRHRLATDLQRAGMSDKEAATYGGWSDIKSLQRYQHSAPRPLQNRSYAKPIKGARRKMGGSWGDA